MTIRLSSKERTKTVRTSVERGNNLEEPTPIEIESALRALDGSRISNTSDLVREVRKRNEFHGEPLDRLDAIVIFVSESTGPSRTRQRFRCSNCDCEAHDRSQFGRYPITSWIVCPASNSLQRPTNPTPPVQEQSGSRA
jgi:hypothetical protein